jgi:hypothetical protein
MQRITKLVPTNHPVSFTFVIMLREAFFCLSDLPGIQLYYRDGCDKDALVLYRCCRGTSDVEGSVHQKLTEFRPILAAILDIFWNFFMYMDICTSFKKNSHPVGPTIEGICKRNSSGMLDKLTIPYCSFVSTNADPLRQ